MKKLSQEQFFRAVDFVMTHARPLDKKLFDYYFSGGSSIAVLNELKHYQNHDGGCGHAIEPDVRMPQSSPIASSVAMQYALAVDASWLHPFIQRTMAYFTNIYGTYGNWPLKLNSMHTAPHAEWWQHSGHPAGTFEANPGAEIIGYYNMYPQSIQGSLLTKFNEAAIRCLNNCDGPLEFHEALCYMRLAETMGEPEKTEVISHLEDMARMIVTKDPAAWTRYCAKPLWLAPDPDSPLYTVLEDLVELNLDFEISNQAADGSWHPFWEWGQYRDVWEQEAKLEWQGYLTVKTLKALYSFGRIEQHTHLMKKKQVY